MNSGQAEATPTSFPFNAGSHGPSHELADRICSVISSTPAGRAARVTFDLLGRHTGIAPVRSFWTNAIPERNTNHRAGDKGLKLGQQYLSQLWIRLDQQQMIRRGSDEPVCDARTDGRCRQTEFPHGAEEASNVLIENLLRGGRWIHGGADVDATPVTPLRPTLAFKLPVPCTDSIRVDREAASQFASARKPVARAKIATEYGQDNLRDQLAINGNFTAGGKPESHEGPLDYSAIASRSGEYCSRLLKRVEGCSHYSVTRSWAEGFMHMGPEDAGRLSILSRGNREAVVRVCVCSGKWLLVLLLLWI